MLNLIELENRWLRYKIKSYIPHITIVISLIIITLLVVTFTGTQKENVVEVNSTKAIVQEEKVIPEKIVAQKIIKPVEEKQVKVVEIKEVKKVEPVPIQTVQNSNSTESVKLSPSLDFMRKMQNSVQPYYSNDNSTPIEDVAEDPVVAVPVKTKVVQKNQEVVREEAANNDSQIQKINIKRQNTQNDIYGIIKRFKKNNNPALSLFVAKKYYELGNYKQAYNYALMTNKINNQIDASWIVFAKSLVKLGKKDEALATLKRYIDNSHSNSAQILLDDIKLGKFE